VRFGMHIVRKGNPLALPIEKREKRKVMYVISEARNGEKSMSKKVSSGEGKIGEKVSRSSQLQRREKKKDQYLAASRKKKKQFLSFLEKKKNGKKKKAFLPLIGRKGARAEPSTQDRGRKKRGVSTTFRSRRTFRVKRKELSERSYQR